MRKHLIALVVGIAFATVGAYLVLIKAPTKEQVEGPVRIHDQSREGEIERDEIWSGEILVTDSIEVPSGVTLTIEPGTRVEFKHYRLDNTVPNPGGYIGMSIKGVLKAIGTPENRIWFTSDSPAPRNGDWGMIYFYDAEEGSIIKYAIIEFGKHAVDMWNSSPTIANTIVRWNNWDGIMLESCYSPLIENCMIYQNGYSGITMEQFNENVVVRHNLIDRNGSSGINHMTASSVIEHNLIVGNQDGISLLDNSFALARYNTIRGSRGAAIWSETGASSAVFQFNTIENNPFALRGLEFSPFTLNFNNFLSSEDVEIGLDEEAVGQVNAENNWWGATEESEIAAKISAGPQVTVNYLPYLTERVGKDPETGEQITAEITFDYVDLKPYDLGYTPGDQAKDRYPYVLPDDDTRRIVKRISSGPEMPWSLAWGDNYLWMANNLDGVCKLDPNTGEVVDSFPPPGLRQQAMTFDGEHLWISDFPPCKVYEINPNNGEVLFSFSYDELYPDGLLGLAWDGEFLCLTTAGHPPGLVKFDRSGNFIQEIDIEGGCDGLTFDGEHFWVASAERIYKLNSAGDIVGSITAGSSDGTWSLAWDGQYLWSGERTNEMWDDNKIFKLEILEVQPL